MDPYHWYVCRPNPDGTGRAPDPKGLVDLGYAQSKPVADEVRRVFACHGTEVLFGARHRAPCSAWRSERFQLNDESLPRFANRLHVFSEGPQGEWGRYLGFVSLRPVVQKLSGGFDYTAVAHMSPPVFMLRPRYHLITCVGGPTEGMHPFRCSPFCTVNENTDNRASCTHAAVHQALLLKRDAFGCVPITGQEMMALLWELNEGQRPFAELRLGATLTDALQVLQHPQVRGGGVVETITQAEFGGRTTEDTAPVVAEAYRCITDYVANDLPVILPLRIRLGGRWLDHSVLVIGMHLLKDPEELPLGLDEDGAKRVDVVELPGRFVIHDIRPDHGPFAEVLAAEVLAGQAWVPDSEAPRLSGISFLAVAPPGTQIGIGGVRSLTKALIQHYDPDYWCRYLRDRWQDDSAKPPNVDELRIVTRLLDTSQVIRRYASRRRPDGSVKPQPEARRLLEESCGATADHYWWCAEVRLSEARQPPLPPERDVPPAVVCMWRVEDGLDAQPRGVIEHHRGKKATLIVRGADSDDQTTYEFETNRA